MARKKEMDESMATLSASGLKELRHLLNTRQLNYGLPRQFYHAMRLYQTERNWQICANQPPGVSAPGCTPDPLLTYQDHHPDRLLRWYLKKKAYLAS